MASITALVGGDGITTANSMTKINTNFANLNSDKIETSTLDTDTALTANSDAKIATQKAVKTYIDTFGAITTGLRQTLIAGATINGAVIPVPVYQNKTDNEVYACDGNDLTALKFMGFATSNGTNGNPIDVVTTGLVSGFTGLSEGEKYYLQDTVGTIGTTTGTYEVLVGIAISETELVITKGKRRASGTTTLSSTASTTVSIGFRPSKVSIFAVSAQTGSADVTQVYSKGGWTVFGGNDCVYVGKGSSDEVQAGIQTTAWYVYSDGTGNLNSGIIDNITDTAFDLNNTKTGSPLNALLFWEAEGDY